MIPNFNGELGTPYGVISGNSMPELADEIFSSGESLNYREYKEEIETAIAKQLGDTFREEDREDLEFVLSCVTHLDAKETSEMASGIDPGDTPEEILDTVLEYLADHEMLTWDEESYEYTAEDGTSYLLSYLGGAPLIWVTKSEYATFAAPCSPCVPGAGDLDTLRDKTEGMLCLCPPPAEWEGLEDRPVHFIPTKGERA